MNKRILVSAGDPSGDFHASNLVNSIKKLDKNITVASLGGNKLSSVSDEFIYNLVDLNIHGFWEPIRQYINLRNVLHNNAVKYIKKTNPDLIILVDYYGFNINIAEYAYSANIPVYYFISPQIWASRYNRVKKIKKYVTHMFVIFPFEEGIYRKEGVPVTFVGHPMLDMIPDMPSMDFRDFPTDNFLIGLFPGSRKPVIRWNLPVMEKTANIIQKEIKNVNFVVIGLSNLKECYKTSMKVLYDTDYATRRQLNLAITTSGTVSLENALLGIPMVVTYRLPWLMYFLIKSIVIVSNICIINIVTNKQVVPELIQKDATPEKISKVIIAWLKNPEIIKKMKKEFAALRNLLGKNGAIDRTASIIVNKLQ